MEIDCSNVLSYVTELKRMCYSFDGTPCHINCPLAGKGCDDVLFISQEHVDIVQKWSDEHPRETMREHFYKLFPNAPKEIDGSPKGCPKYLGWLKDCPDEGPKCSNCWNRPYIEVEK